jgi:lysophospholipase L1-like esterase
LNRIHQIIAALVSLLILFLVIEGGLRLVGLGPKATMNAFDPSLGWTKTPSTSIRRNTGEFDVTFSTNSRGLREDESLGYAKPAGEQRVLVVGDSFTLGYTVDRPDTITQLLEKELASQGRSVQVINGGTEGYSTDQEVLWLAREGAKYSPDVVVLQMYENDVFWNSQDRYLRYPKPKLRADGDAVPATDALPALSDPGRDPWLQRSTAIGSLLGGLSGGPSMPMLDGPRPLPAEWGTRLRDGAAGWPETRAALRAFAAVARKIGAKPLVLVIPDKAQVDPQSRAAMAEQIADPGYDPDRPYRGMVEAAKAAGLTVVDALPAMKQAADGGKRQLYFARDWHTNPAGNRVVANLLTGALAQPDLLGAPPREARPLDLPEEASEGAGRWLRNLGTFGALWALLGTLFLRRFPDLGAGYAYGWVAALLGTVAASFLGIDVLTWLLPAWLARWVSTAIVVGLLGAILWYLRERLPVMGELFGSFVRRGQWYLLPVLVGLLSIGGLLVVAASSPWLAPFIYTLF